MYVSEIPTNRLRAYNVALASFTHWVHNLAISKATPVMMVTNPWRAYFIFGSFNFVMGIGGFFVPETKGVSFKLPGSAMILQRMRRQKLTRSSQISLERMDEIFGSADFSKVEDIGIAAKVHKEVDEDVDEGEENRASKV